MLLKLGKFQIKIDLTFAVVLLILYLTLTGQIVLPPIHYGV